MRPPAPLIAFEGIDGSGKSTAVARVAKALQSRVPGLVTTREETEGPSGTWVRQSIAEGMDPLATTFLFLADRAEHLAQLRAWREAGQPVLCDRYLHSTLAYQSVTLQDRVSNPLEFLRRLHEPWCPQPDHVLLFRADPATCVERTQRRGETTRYEKVEFLQRVQDAYLELAKLEPQRFHVVDAERPLDDVVHDATTIVTRILSS